MNNGIDNVQETAPAIERKEEEVSKGVFAVAPDVWRMKDIFVNVFMVQNSEAKDWVLIDAGLKSTYSKIKKGASDLFGADSRPTAIIMTHGHFDHRGAVQQLATEWNVPVYCHHMERPYLIGKAAYPPPDSGVGGGLMASMAFAYPKGPINIENHLRELPDDGTIPELKDWRWIHTPGHTPGHISLFRESDRVLIAGDAFVTTKQESAFSVMTQKEVVSGPPKYFTPDWVSAANSVKALAELKPEIIASGHGHSLYGEKGIKGLEKLAKNFWHDGIPQKGRYVSEPAEFDENGPTYVPPTQNNYMLMRLVGATTMVLVGYYLYRKNQKSLAKTLFAGSITMLTAPVPQL